MKRKYRIGEKVTVNYGNKTVVAEVFAFINLELGKKTAYSLRIDKHFVFVGEEDIIGRVDE